MSGFLKNGSPRIARRVRPSRAAKIAAQTALGTQFRCIRRDREACSYGSSDQRSNARSHRHRHRARNDACAASEQNTGVVRVSGRDAEHETGSGYAPVVRAQYRCAKPARLVGMTEFPTDGFSPPMTLTVQRPRLRWRYWSRKTWSRRPGASRLRTRCAVGVFLKASAVTIFRSGGGLWATTIFRLTGGDDRFIGEPFGAVFRVPTVPQPRKRHGQ